MLNVFFSLLGIHWHISVCTHDTHHEFKVSQMFFKQAVELESITIHHYDTVIFSVKHQGDQNTLIYTFCVSHISD